MMANPSGRKKGEPRPESHNPGRTKLSDRSRAAHRREKAEFSGSNRAERAEAKRVAIAEAEQKENDEARQALIDEGAITPANPNRSVDPAGGGA